MMENQSKMVIKPWKTTKYPYANLPKRAELCVCVDCGREQLAKRECSVCESENLEDVKFL
jgi:hypothetical protein